MTLPLTSFFDAVRDARWQEAATDAALWARWREQQDPLSRALLIVAAAHLHDAGGNVEGARMKLQRAVAYLEQAREHPLAMWMLAHVRAALQAVEAEERLPLLQIEDAPR